MATGRTMGEADMTAMESMGMQGMQGMQAPQGMQARAAMREQKFADLVRLHAYDRKFITREQEMKILEEGVMRYGLPLAEARGTLMSIAEEEHAVFERDVEKSVRDMMATFAGRRGKIARAHFAHAVSFYRASAGSALSDADISKRVKAIMVDNNWQPRGSGMVLRTRRWYRRIA
jgi:hypothetical protein